MPSPKAFLETQNFESKPPRNSFDNSKSVNMTGQLGGIYPCGLWEVNPGDSFQIESAFAFNFFPTIFPLQTPLMARIYYFYGRNRVLQDSWKDFAYNNKQVVPPYIVQNPKTDFWRTGSLADYLGVPTTYSNLPKETANLIPVATYKFGSKSPVKSSFYANFRYENNPSSSVLASSSTKTLATTYGNPDSDPSLASYCQFIMYGIDGNPFMSYDDFRRLSVLSFSPGTASSWRLGFFCFDVRYRNDIDKFNSGYLICLSQSHTSSMSFDLESTPDIVFTYSPAHDSVTQRALTYDLKKHLLEFLEAYPNLRICPCLCVSSVDSPMLAPWPVSHIELAPTDNFYSLSSASAVSGRLIDLADLDVNPFAGSTPVIPLSAIPFRFYEALYNAYFRDEKNDPFIVDGELEYNKYNTTTADGADSTPYHIYFRNWDADFLTTASQTPQQGLAPLVGINYRGDMEFLNDDGTIAKIRPAIAKDGHTITGVEGVIENGTPESVRSAMNYISMGISINDFREVNSLQRWLENNIRRGLRYRDQVLANTGVKVKYDELDMPVFLGGYSRPVQMQQVTQQSPSTAADNALGDRAGQLGVFGGSKHKITHYCDEAGFIMAVVCISPTPVYSQLLPKYFLKSSPLDYYNPTFGHIGMQPIDYREVCPVQAFKDGKNVFDVFGYQRPWYDLLGCVDEVHGEMRTTMRDFVMNRTFAGVPELGADFLHIDPKQLNQVFAYTDEKEDVFQGQIYHKVYVKRAIPRFGIPRLE